VSYGLWNESSVGHPVGEEVYGPLSTPELLRLRRGLLAAPNRLATVTTTLLKREEFDVVWVTASAAHLAGHRFLKMSQVAAEIDLAQHPELETTVAATICTPRRSSISSSSITTRSGCMRHWVT